MRAAIYEEFGDDLFGSFDQVAAALERRLAEWSNDAGDGRGDDSEDGAGTRKSLPEKRRKKLLHDKTWERDGRLVEVATALRAALPYTPDAWVNNDATKIGYEVSFTCHFYKPQLLRTLAEISADILAVAKEAEGLLDGLLLEAPQP